MPVLDRKVIFFLHFYTPNAKFKTHSVIFIVLVRPTYFVFPLQSSIIFSECNNFPLKYQIVFNECVKYNKSFHLVKVTGKMRILSSNMFNSVPQHLRKVERLQWRSSYRLGCVCASVSSQCSGNGVLGCLLTVLWWQSVHRLGTSPESRSGPGDWWLLSVSNYSISKYLNRTIVWGELRVCFLPAPGWPSSDLPTATLKFAQCSKVGCF